MSNIRVENLGKISYKNAWDYQEKLFNDSLRKKHSGESFDDYFLLCEHNHVYTLGKSGEENNLLINSDFLEKINAEFFKTNRGGDITYHGPGQIVGYPIIDLEKYGMGTKEYIYTLEYMIIDVLKEFGISGEISQNNIGVWLGVGTPKERKICAIGVKVSRGITMHGFALNVNTDLSYYNHINPCGFIDKGVTSMQKELGFILDFEEIVKKTIEAFTKSFN
jgi:lipoyl(octanoyl) transferase